MAAADINKIKDVLKKDGLYLDTSSTGRINEFRRIYENTADSNFEILRTVRKDGKDCGALAGGTGVTEKGRKKNLFKAHIQACKQWAGMMFNENTRLEIKDALKEGDKKTGKTELERLKKHYEDYGLWRMLEQAMFEVFGIGTVGVVTEYDNNYGVVHKVYPAEAVYPLTTIAGKVREAAFVSELIKDDKKYTIVNVHLEEKKQETMANGENPPLLRPATPTHIIKNYAFEGGVLVDVAQLGFKAEYTSSVRMFAILKPFGRQIENYNNVAYGVPVYYDCKDMIGEIDDLYDIKQRDTQTSQRVIFVNKEAMVFDKNGRALIPQFLMGVIVSLKPQEGQGGFADNMPVTDFAPTPKCDVYSQELQDALNRFAIAVGLGSESFKHEKSGVVTATQVISENQEKYVHLAKHNSVMASEFIALNKAVLSCFKEFEGGSFNLDVNIGYFVQDGVVLDDETQRQIAMSEVAAGLMTEEWYLREYRGLSGDDLDKELTRLKDMGADEYAAEINNAVNRLNTAKTLNGEAADA